MGAGDSNPLSAMGVVTLMPFIKRCYHKYNVNSLISFLTRKLKELHNDKS